MSSERRYIIREQAAEWVVRSANPTVTQRERRELLSWLKQSPRHVQEFLIAQNLYQPFRSSRIELPPGHMIAVIASFILTKGAYQRYVAPQIADMQYEYIEAIRKGDERLARWVRIRGYGLIAWALFGSVLKSLITRLVPSAK